MFNEQKKITEKYEKPILIELGNASDLIAGNSGTLSETHTFKPCQDGTNAASHVVKSNGGVLPTPTM